jgi:excisionase family DNA binding protein
VTEDTRLTPSQAARHLGLSKARVLQLSNDGRLPAVRTPLGRLFEFADVERLAEQRKRSKLARVAPPAGTSREDMRRNTLRPQKVSVGG